MSVTVHSFAKINLGLCIGRLRPDGFHELRTVYQTIALHDVIRLSVGRGTGIEIRCDDSQVPANEANTCYRIVERALPTLKSSGRVIIRIEKKLPVRGGLGGASGNAVAALLALERALKKEIPHPHKLRIAAEVGSDLPLFLVGGTVLGLGRGEEVYPLADFPPVACVIVTPAISISTPKAFADWDLMVSGRAGTGLGSLGPPGTADQPSLQRSRRLATTTAPRRAEVTAGIDAADNFPSQAGLSQLAPKLTLTEPSDRILTFGRNLSAWLSRVPELKTKLGGRVSGVPAPGRGRAETLLLDLVRTGIENDFEQVVFPQYPELGEVKCLLARAGAIHASLSGSGSAVYGLFRSQTAAQKAAARLRKSGVPAQVTVTLTRQQYWNRIFDC
jgi:4-diphosphocytidyl-2-C-methyl-D-erythritol kinase